MISSKALFLSALFLPLPATAQDHSAKIATTGLATTKARLAARPTQIAADAFALGGTRFLRVVGTTYQTRYRTGMDDPTGMAPLLRLPAGAAPHATFAPADVAA